MMIVGKLLTLLVGVIVGAGLVGVTVGLAGALLVVTVLALTLLGRRDWVPAAYNLRSLGMRRWTTGATALGFALVVFIITTVLMLASGVRETLKATGGADNVKIVRKGATNELMSLLTPEQVRLASSAPEVAIGSDGQPRVCAELLGLIFATRESAATAADGSNIGVRGVGPKALELHPPRALAGRMFTAGTSEVVIGKGLVGRFQGMRLGGEVTFSHRQWRVVGIADHAGSAYDSELWGDVEQVMDAFGRRPNFTSLTVQLRDHAALETLRARTATDPMLAQMEAQREIDYWTAQSEQVVGFVRGLGLFVALIFSFGAMLGAMITMYTQVSARTREIGALRAVGFRRRALLVSFVIESLMLALVAGIAGIAAASTLQLTSFSTTNFQTFSEMSFRFHLSPPICVASLTFALLMGFAGGFLPAVRAARLPIVRATRGG